MVGNKVTLNIWQALKRFDVKQSQSIVVNKNQLLFLENLEHGIFVFKTEDNKQVLLPANAEGKTVIKVF